MKFFIDTANLEQIKEAQALGVLDGVTTNPSLMAKEGITGAQNILNHYVEICNIVDGPVSAEVISTDFDGMIKEGEELAKLHKNIVVKVPMISEGIKAIKYFSSKGIKTNCTLVFSRQLVCCRRRRGPRRRIADRGARAPALRAGGDGATARGTAQRDDAVTETRGYR